MDGAVATSSHGLEELEALAAALELAERSERLDEASRLKERLAQVEAERPVATLLFRQQRQVALLLDCALFETEDVAAQVDAVRSLCSLGSPPAATSEAEQALHKVLRVATGNVRAAAESALWDVWSCTGEEELDDLFRKGAKLLEDGQSAEALKCFTELTHIAPDHAEGWNKRATALYMLERFDSSIEDCHKVLHLKPQHFGCLSGLGMCYLQKGDEKEAIKWLREAVHVNPGMEKAQRAILNVIVQDRLSPMVGATVEALSGGTELTLPASEEGVVSDWDVHRVAPNDSSLQACIYFFRVRVRNESTATRSVKSLARFYVLRFKDGKIVPFARLTDGDSSFVLGPGEEYRYCWALVVAHELHEMAGGVLMERLEAGRAVASEAADGERYPRARMEPSLSPHMSSKVTMRDVQDLGRGYYYTGQLDLRNKPSDSI